MNCAVRLGSSQRSKGLGSHIPNCIFLFLGPCEVSSLISCLLYNTLLYILRGRNSRNCTTTIWLWGTAAQEVWHFPQDLYQTKLPSMELLLHFVLSLHNNSVSSQIIYSTSRHAPFPSSLICLGYYRYLNESWPYGWYMLEEFTKDLSYNLYSATRMGDFGANLLFLCHPFSVSSVLQGLWSVRGLPEGKIIKCPRKLNSANLLETRGLH